MFCLGSQNMKGGGGHGGGLIAKSCPTLATDGL